MFRVIRLLAIGWLTLVVGFIGGLYVYGAQVWPYQAIKTVEIYVKGHKEEGTSLVKKIANDLNITPWRHLVGSPGINITQASKYKELKGLPLNQRRKNPMIYLGDTAPSGYRVIFGTFDFLDTLYGVVLLNPQGQVAHVWKTTQEYAEWDHRPDTNVVPHGFEILSDGSILTGYDFGTSITRQDYCGRIIWKINGNYHHSINFGGEHSFWVWESYAPTESNYFVEIHIENGQVLRKFTLGDVMNANLDIDIFGIRQIDGAEESKWAERHGEQWHPNDIEVLPKKLEKYYPGFKAGDLLVSLRAPNLIFVMDPETLKVKWWRQGLTRRQHDPDWNERGTITVFNNNMHRGYSMIQEIHPMTFNSDVLVDGKDYEFYSRVWGKHQFLPTGEVLVTSAMQGRVFEVDMNGDITFEFVNTYNEENQAMIIAEARFLPVEFFKELPQC